MKIEYLNHTIQADIYDNKCKYTILLGNEVVSTKEFEYKPMIGKEYTYKSLINSAKKEIDNKNKTIKFLCSLNK